jgi:hypothetical protein
MKARYENLNEAEKAVLCNGVGPQNLGWICGLLPLRGLFEEAANRHDFDYGVGGGLAQYARANLRFYAGCLYAIADKGSLCFWPWELFMAHVYHVLVIIGGEASFHWGIPRTQEQMHELAVQLNVKEIEEALSKEK